MNPTYPNIELLGSLETSSGSIPKPIQVVQPIPAACPSPVSVQPIPDQTACLSPLIMTAPVSSPMVTYLATSSTISIPQASNSLMSSSSSGKPSGLMSSSPYVYQSIPLGQQFFLANTPQNGFVITQPPGASYMIAHPQPQFQVRAPAGGQTIPMALVLGTQPPSGLIHLSQHPTPANVISAANPPIVCANPAVAVQPNLPASSFPQIHPGVTVARFPNGCPIAPNTTTTVSTVATITVANTTAITTTSMSGPSVVAVSTATGGSTVTRPTMTTPESVLLELNKEINNLDQIAANSTTPLTLQQSNRLQRLLQARDQVLRTIENAKSRSPGAAIRPSAPLAANATLRPRPSLNTPASILPTVRNPSPIALSPAMGTSKVPIRPIPYPPTREARRNVSSSLATLRVSVSAFRPPLTTLSSSSTIQPRLSGSITLRPARSVRTEVINLLVKHRLLPMNIAMAAGESVLVEFRLTSQRYQLWLTRAQKVDLEQLLYTLPTNQRKAEVLIVYQQEQARFFAAHPRPAPSVAAQLRLLRPPPPPPPQSQSQTTSQQNSVPQQAIHSPRQPLSSATMCVLTPVPASTANTSSSPTASLPLKVPLFSASPTLVRAPGVIAPASSSCSSVTTVACTTPVHVAPTNQMSLLQSRRLNAIRTLLHADQVLAISRPPVLAEDAKRPMLLPEELLNILAPYHTQQDMDNTPHAMAKVDGILDKAFRQLFVRKQQTEDAVHSILYAEKWQLMDCPQADRLPLTRLALESDRERFEAERAAFEKLKARLSADGCRPLPPKRIRQFLEDAAPDFVPLEFDEKGNSRPATLHLEDCQPEPKGEELETSVEESPKTSVKCAASVEEGAWPEWEEDEDEEEVEEEEETIITEEGVGFQPPGSPGVDIANVVVEEEEAMVNSFGGHEQRSPLNGLSMSFIAPSTPLPEVSKSAIETGIGMPYQRLQHSEDPTIDAAIRSIIDL